MNDNVSKDAVEQNQMSFIKSRPLVLGVLFGVVLLVIAFKSSTLTAVGESLSQAKLLPYFLGIASYGVYLFIRAFRWRLLMLNISQRLPFLLLLKATFWGTAANVIIPHSGEVLRSFLVRGDLGVPATKVLGAIATERIFDFVTVILLTAGVLLTYSGAPNLLVSALITLSVMGSVVAVGALVICARERYIRAVSNVLSKVLPKKASGHLLWQFEQLAFGIQKSLRTPKLMHVIGLSFAQWITITLCIYASMVSVDITPSYWVALIVLPLTIAGLTLPTAPGYLGTIQVAFLIALGSLGIADEQALAASFVYLGIVAFPVVVVSLAWYLFGKFTSHNHSEQD